VQGLQETSGLYDFVNSFIVLQHIPVKTGMQIIDRLLAMVRPGGGASLHICVERRSSLRGELAYFAKHNVPGARQLINLLAGRPAGFPAILMSEYPLLKVLELFRQRGFADVLTTVEYHSSATVYLTGRKCAA
jgi:hypothetical protein